MTIKRIFHRSIGSLLIVALLATMSACGTIDTENKNDESILAESDASPLEGQESSSVELQEVPSKIDSPVFLQECSTQTDELETFRYWLYVPENPTGQLPLIVYLHGASGRSEDLEQVVSDGDFPKYLQSGEFGDVRAYVLIPQLPSSFRGWSDISDSLYSLIQKTVSECSIDENNISLAGFSMGGTATWEFAAKHPDLFARIAPLSGSARAVLEQAEALKNIPVWAFVGSADTVIKPNSSEQMVAELKKVGGIADITIFDGADHISVPALAYQDEKIQLVDWLIGEAE